MLLGMRTSTIELRGPYSLEEVALMGFGHRDERGFDGVMRLAFCLDTDLEQQVGVEVRQAGQRLDLVVHGAGRPGSHHPAGRPDPLGRR